MNRHDSPHHSPGGGDDSSLRLPSFRRQDSSPLYPKVLYNRPITRMGAGRLLVVGGHSGEFSLPTAVHQFALAAGAGECRVVLPDNLAKLLSGAPGTAFAASTISGSLSRDALGRILELSEEADAAALGASLSSNSNTTMLAERLVAEIERPLIVFDEGLTALSSDITAVTDNPDVLIIATMAEVFKLCGKLGIPIHIRPDAGLLNKLEIVQNLAAAGQCAYAVFGTEIITAQGDHLTVTPINYRLSLIPAIFYGTLSTFWLQNPSDRNAGLVTGAYVIREAGSRLGATDRPTTAMLAQAISQVVAQDNF